MSTAGGLAANEWLRLLMYSKSKSFTVFVVTILDYFRMKSHDYHLDRSTHR